ncbi:MAG: hypothetical protein FH751_16265 [Firmicutes bacterium]|nr:hypothetical protein [Bacillota bacterium]
MASVIVFGLSSGGLFLLRELSKSENVIGIGKKEQIGLMSKYGTKYQVDTSEDLRIILKNILKKEREKPRAIIAGGYFLTMILEDIPEVFNDLNIIGPSFNTYKILNDKYKTYDLLKKFNIPYPDTYPLLDKNKYKYPLILKWSSVELNRSKKIIKKIKIIKTEEQLENIFKSIDLNDTKLLLQRYLSDGFKEYRYGCFLKNGEIILDIFVKAKRQYPSGISSFIVEIENDYTLYIKENIIKMLKAIKYIGFIQFDILVNESSGKYFVLDVNPRPWSSIKILKKKYESFNKLLKISEFNIRNKKVQWVNLSTDAVSIIKISIKNKSLKYLFKSYYEYFKKPIITDVIELGDIKPFFGLVKLAFKKLKRLIKTTLRKCFLWII